MRGQLDELSFTASSAFDKLISLPACTTFHCDNEYNIQSISSTSNPTRFAMLCRPEKELMWQLKNTPKFPTQLPEGNWLIPYWYIGMGELGAVSVCQAFWVVVGTVYKAQHPHKMWHCWSHKSMSWESIFPSWAGQTHSCSNTGSDIEKPVWHPEPRPIYLGLSPIYLNQTSFPVSELGITAFILSR